MTLSNPNPYGCHNSKLRGPADTYVAQDGYHAFVEGNSIVRGAPRWVDQKGFTAFPGCVYDRRRLDARCAGCYKVGLNPDGSVDAEYDPDFKEVSTAPAATTQDLVYIPLIK